MWSIAKNFGSNDAYTVRLDLTAAEQSVENNRTALHFACWLISNRASASFTGQAKTDTLTVAGVTVNPAHGYYVLQGGGSVLLWECDMTVGHDSDGTFSEKSVSCGVLIDTTFSSSGYVGTVTAEGTMTLTAIPRASSMSVGELTLGTTGSAAITAASASFRHDSYLTVGGATACLCYDKQGGGSVGITPSLGDFAPQITDAAAKTAEHGIQYKTSDQRTERQKRALPRRPHKKPIANAAQPNRQHRGNQRLCKRSAEFLHLHPAQAGDKR